jgi:hypothetical protein
LLDGILHEAKRIFGEESLEVRSKKMWICYLNILLIVIKEQGKYFTKSELLRYGPKPLRKADILDISVRHLLILGKLHIFKNGKKNLYTLMIITTV